MQKSLIIIFLCLVGKPSSEQILLPSTKRLRNFSMRQTTFKIDSTEEALESVSQFRFQTGYTSKVVFVGRDFGVHQFGVAPGVTYHHRSGVNLEYEGNYWRGMRNRFAFANAGIYYEKFLSDNFYLSTGYWRVFFYERQTRGDQIFHNFFILLEGLVHKIEFVSAIHYF